MEKDLYNSKPLDKLEEELMRDDIKYIPIENIESEKLRYQKIAQSSIAKKEFQMAKDINQAINEVKTGKSKPISRLLNSIES